MWITKPEVIYSTVLFLIAFFASVYPSTFRKMFVIPIKRFKSRSLKTLQFELSLLENLHDNSYNLLI